MRFALAALTLAACATPATDDWSSVLPDERLRVDFPDGGLRGAGDPSEYQALTHEVTTDVNALIDTVLASLAFVTAFDPTWSDTTEDTLLWGPWTDDGLDGRLWMTRDAAGATTWALEGRPTGSGDDAWLAVASGEIAAGATDLASAGSFLLDIDHIAALDPAEVSTGQFVVVYAMDGDVVTADASFLGFSEDLGQLADATYHYEQTVGVEGLMDLAVWTDATGDGSPEEHLIRSRWNDVGEGRADAWLTGGSFGELVYTASECWDAARLVVYYEDNATLTTSGDEALCAYGEAEYSDPEGPGA